MTRQVMGEHRCQGCGSAFYENDIFQYAGKWYHPGCFESLVDRDLLAYEDNGEFAVNHHKNRVWFVQAMKDYMRIGPYENRETFLAIQQLLKWAK